MLLTLFKIIGLGIAVSDFSRIIAGNNGYTPFSLVHCNLDIFLPVFDSSYTIIICPDLLFTSISTFVIEILGFLILLFIIKALVALFNSLYSF